MSSMKYIVVDTGLVDAIIIFPDVIQHNTFAESFPYIVSAGFITMSPKGVYTCYGKSYSLGIGSREIDSQIANEQII